jgi:hypothetical protein
MIDQHAPMGNLPRRAMQSEGAARSRMLRQWFVLVVLVNVANP